MGNFEEHWELKQSIRELEQLERENQVQVQQLEAEIAELEGLPKASQLCVFKRSELHILAKNQTNNR